MSYQVLARKWRPGKFSELVGQEHVVTAIANALDNDRLHHAYLFTGTRGVGKTTIARIFSKSLNCETGQGANPCGVCDTCREIEHGHYVDLLEIDAASRTKVEDTRELLDNVQYKPTRGRYKVYLIDEVHMLSKHSFNALLKTLEEPPPHVKFLLATTDPQKLPVTILSRCLQFNLKALSREQISGQLLHILQHEQITFEPAALALLARAAQGSMRDALSLTDQAIAQGDNQVSAAIVTDMLGLMDRNQILKLLFALVKKEPEALLEIVAQMTEQAPDFSQVLAELASLLHQIALTQWVPDACKLETTAAKAIYQLAKAMSAEQVQLFYQIALQGRKDLPYAVDGRSALEMTLLRMMSFAPVPSGDDNFTLITEGEGAQPTPVSSAPAMSSTVVPQTGEQSVTDSPALTVEQNAPVPEPSPSPEAGFASESGALGDDDAEIESLEAEQNAIEQMADEYRQPATSTEPVQGSQPDAVQADKPEQAPSFQAEDNAPPQWDDIPPENYDDMLMPDNDDGNYQDPYHTDIPPAAPNTSNDNTASLSSMEDMLALRQKLKTGRRGADETPGKKQQPGNEDTSDRVRRLSLRGQRAVASTEARPAKPHQTEPEEQPEAIFHASKAEEPPPWVTDESQSVEPASHAPISKTVANYTSSDLPALSSPPAKPQDETESPRETASAVQRVDNDALPAYLPDGTKLLLGRQIDSWSERVAGLGLAGLTKQIVLNAAFSQNGDQVTLELDDSQSHLINDGAVAQLSDALSQALGQTVVVQIVYGKPQQTPLSLQARIDTMRQVYAQEVVSNDEKFNTLRDMFSASVVKDTVQPR